MNSVVISQDEEIGPYRLLGFLGRGGMAEVWKAEHRHLGQVRALKVLLPEIAARSDLVGRLMTEARATAWLRHPVIVEVFDCDVLADGRAFIAMEHLQGEQLRTWLDRMGTLAEHPRLAAAIVGRAAEGLAFAHSLGVVHRDLKPDNLFLCPVPTDATSFTVKLLDFGIAKLLHDEAPSRTRPGAVVGTPSYMAPEQWRPGLPVDHRADIYALGCLTHELLTGLPPFPVADELRAMYAHLAEPPPSMTSLHPPVPAPLGELVSRMLAKQPDDRPQSMAAVISALEAFLGLERARFVDLLRAPPEFPVRVTVPEAGQRTWLGVGSEQPGGNLGPPTPTLAGPGTRRRRRWRKRLVLASLAVPTVVALAAVWFARDRGGGPLPPIAQSPASPAVAVAAARAATERYTVRISSVPAGAEAWVDGETSPRGRTPLELVFSSARPRTVRLVATGFRPHTMAVRPAEQQATSAVLARKQPAADKTPGRAVRYQAVGD